MCVEGFVEESSRHRVESLSFSQRQNFLMILVSFLHSLKQSLKQSYIILSNNKLLINDVTSCKVNNTVE